MKFRLRQSISENDNIIYILEYTQWLLDWRHPCLVEWNCILDTSGVCGWYTNFEHAYEALEKCKSWEAKFIS
jgi:hypothetical protein